MLKHKKLRFLQFPQSRTMSGIRLPQLQLASSNGHFSFGKQDISGKHQSDNKIRLNNLPLVK